MLTARDLTFVVRCAGERTMDAAIALLKRQVADLGGDPHRQVIAVSLRPFVSAVRATLEYGRSAGRPWTIGMDADVLLLNGGVQRLIDLCQGADRQIYTITTLVNCKFFGGFCFRGIHAYPTRLLDEALSLIDTCGAADSLRPETSVVNAMLARGYTMVGPPWPVGLHDFEQSYRHIYLKMRLRARRELSDEPGKTSTPYFDFVAARAASDTDYLVASWGLADGRSDALSGSGPAHYDWDAAYPELDERLARAGLHEKAPLDIDACRGLADAVMAGHSFAADTRTPKWIRDRHRFTDPAGGVWARMSQGPEHSAALAA